MTSHTPQPPAGDDELVRQALDCDSYPQWLHDLIDAAGEHYASEHEDWSTEQAIAYAVLRDRAQHTEPAAGEVEVVRYGYHVSGFLEPLEDGDWVRLVDYQRAKSSYDALAAAKDAKTEKWRAACMEARGGCNQRSDTIRSLRSHLEAAERQRDALRETLRRIEGHYTDTALASKHMAAIARTALSEAEGGA